MESKNKETKQRNKIKYNKESRVSKENYSQRQHKI